MPARLLHAGRTPRDPDGGDDSEGDEPARDLEPVHPLERRCEARVGDQARSCAIIMIERIITHVLRPRLAGVAAGGGDCARSGSRLRQNARRWGRSQGRRLSKRNLTDADIEDPELKAIPVIAVTAFAMKGDEERIREGGCEAYLSKPISVAKFIETIRRFLGLGLTIPAVSRGK
jgi:hypothetical protein